VGSYETRLRAGLGAVAEEAGEFLRGAGPLRRTLLRLARELEREQVPYAVVGAMALGGHGFARMTEDVDVLVTDEGLARFRDRLVGRGYTATHAGATRQFRDAETGVRIEFLVAGEFPGDGRPKAVAFPDPARVAAQVEDGVRFVDLEPLVELKLASGLSAPHRLRDLADVQDLIRVRELGSDLAERLDPSVRDGYLDLWRAVHDAPPERD
jgi:hypothetical protein